MMSVINIGVGLVELGKWVLLIDFDFQANFILVFGVLCFFVIIYEVMWGELGLQFVMVKENLDVVVFMLDFFGVEMELINEVGWEFILQEFFDLFLEEYDFIIIDCLLFLGLFMLNVFISSDFVMILFQIEFFVMQGLVKIKQVI